MPIQNLRQKYSFVYFNLYVLDRGKIKKLNKIT
jgi:hypothetical protein